MPEVSVKVEVDAAGPGDPGAADIAGADVRREQMLRAALEVIAERGFPDARIADVAERSGTSPALVIYYFKTKDNLLTEAMRYAEDGWYAVGAARLSAIESATGRLEELVAMTCLPESVAELPDSWVVWLELWSQSARHAEVGRVRADFDRHWRETIRTIVEEGQREGEFGDVDAGEFAVVLSALLDGFAIQIALDDDTVQAAKAFELSMRFAADRLSFEWSTSTRMGGRAEGRSQVAAGTAS
jgi:AcrR family transcriptional regulator